MRIYYRKDLLCGKTNGNGEKLSLIRRRRYFLRSELELQPFSLEDINSILHNKHQSIGCSIDAPFKYVGWQSKSQWYELPKGPRAFLPKCIVFTVDNVSYCIVMIGDEYELRLWRDAGKAGRTETQWFSHEPIVDAVKLRELKTSFYVLLEHIRKEDEFEERYPKFPKK